jgi:hypothetical protein
MLRVRKSYAFDKMFASIFLTVIASLALLKMTAFLEWYALPWTRQRPPAGLNALRAGIPKAEFQPLP